MQILFKSYCTLARHLAVGCQVETQVLADGGVNTTLAKSTVYFLKLTARGFFSRESSGNIGHERNMTKHQNVTHVSLWGCRGFFFFFLPPSSCITFRPTKFAFPQVSSTHFWVTVQPVRRLYEVHKAIRLIIHDNTSKHIFHCHIYKSLRLRVDGWVLAIAATAAEFGDVCGSVNRKVCWCIPASEGVVQAAAEGTLVWIFLHIFVTTWY